MGFYSENSDNSGQKRQHLFAKHAKLNFFPPDTRLSKKQELLLPFLKMESKDINNQFNDELQRQIAGTYKEKASTFMNQLRSQFPQKWQENMEAYMNNIVKNLEKSPGSYLLSRAISARYPRRHTS